MLGERHVSDASERDDSSLILKPIDGTHVFVGGKGGDVPFRYCHHPLMSGPTYLSKAKANSCSSTSLLKI